MKDNSDFIPRHGSPLFYPQDPDEGFVGGSGRSTRRKFLKRTGGATAAAFIAAVPMKLEAVPEHESSEEWDMDHAGYSPADSSGQVKSSGFVEWFDVDKDEFVGFMVELDIYSAPVPGADITDVLEIEMLSIFILTAHTGTTFGESVVNQMNTVVVCDSSGHLAHSSTPGEEPGQPWPEVSTDVTYEGKTFRLTLTSAVSNESSFQGISHGADIVASAQGIITELDGNNSPLAGGISVRIPDNFWGDPLYVANYFESKRTN
jgi:hypothetical protein